MKYLLPLFAFIFLNVQLSSAQLVLHVFDGDTYKILDSGKCKIVRLANVDAPELSQYYGKTVRTGVSKLILARIVRLQVVGKDRYGRIVANVLVDGVSLDSLFIAKGWAWHYTQYSHHKSLAQVELLAKKVRKGMWVCKDNIPPWLWRKLNEKQKRLKEMCR